MFRNCEYLGMGDKHFDIATFKQKIVNLLSIKWDFS